MPFLLDARPARIFVVGCSIAAFAALGARAASAEALLLVQADNGKVLHAENATYPWHPASVTKLMTAYVTLHAIKQGNLTLETLLTVSGNAVAQQPTKMGFKAGTQVTVDNALKMMMVKSANDMAVTLAEGVGGSIENFAAIMNQAARHLGMTQSNFVNPNGLPADDQMTSARDLAILARALIAEFPEYGFYWRIPAIKLGRRIVRNYNTLIDRYPGADGMKTGFICASGFNLVATATRDNKRLIAVVLGAPSSSVRAEQAVRLFEKGFNSSGMSWLLPSVDSLTPVEAQPADLHDEMCGKHRRRPAAEALEEETASSDANVSSAYAAMNRDVRAAVQKMLLGPYTPSMPPIEVFVGARKRSSPQLAASPAPGAIDGTPAIPAKPERKKRSVPVPRPRPGS